MAADLKAAGGASSSPETLIATLDGKTNLADFVKRTKVVATAAGPFSFDRRTRFGHRDRLDYSIPILWAMAEHRSQGTLQMMVGRAAAQAARAADWVALLSQPTFVVPEYGASAGTNAAADGVRPESTQDVRSK